MSGRILILEDDDSLRLVISKALSRAGFEVRSTASPQTAVGRLAAGEADALVADVLLGKENFLDRLEEVARLRPEAPVIVMSAQTTAATALGAARQGAFEYLAKPFDLNDLVDILQRALKRPDAPVRTDRDGYAGLVGRSAAMQSAFRSLGRLAKRADPVLIVGPDGSGRAAFGRVLHKESGRSGALVEAGPERLRDAPDTLNARGATLLLRRAEAWDEPTRGRVLERLEAEPEDGARLIVTAAPDVRRALPGALIDRLAVGLLDLPPVRLRGEDRGRLFRHFLTRAGQGRFSLSQEAEAFINAQAWPGEVAAIRRTAERIAAQGVPGAVSAQDVAAALAVPQPADPDTTLEDAAARYFAEAQADGDVAARAQAALDAGLIRAALEAAGGVRQEAARRLGMNRNTFARRIAVLGLDEAEPDARDAP
jgi:two-component system nitrogen regulation response regulator GlnG